MPLFDLSATKMQRWRDKGSAPFGFRAKMVCGCDRHRRTSNPGAVVEDLMLEGVSSPNSKLEVSRAVHADLPSVSSGRQSFKNSAFLCMLRVTSAPPALLASTIATTFTCARQPGTARLGIALSRLLYCVLFISAPVRAWRTCTECDPFLVAPSLASLAEQSRESPKAGL